MVLALFSLLLSACTKPEVDYRDKWIGKYEYSCNSLYDGTLNVKKVGDNQVSISIIEKDTKSTLTVEHDGTFRGTTHTSNHIHTIIDGMFYSQDSLCFDYWTGIAHGAGTAIHRRFIAKKISSSL